jgi:hypothetical protein
MARVKGKTPPTRNIASRGKVYRLPISRGKMSDATTITTKPQNTAASAIAAVIEASKKGTPTTSMAVAKKDISMHKKKR